MLSLLKLFRRKHENGERGVSAVEYALLVALVSIGLFVAIYNFKGKIMGWFETEGEKITEP